MPKFNIIEWVRAFFRRRYREDHVIVVNIYDNGKRVCRLSRIVTNTGAISFHTQLGAANSLVSTLYGEELKAAKKRGWRK